MLDKIKSFMNEDEDYEYETYQEEEENTGDLNNLNTDVKREMVHICTPVAKTSVDNVLKNIKKKELCIVNYSSMDEHERSAVEEQIKGALFALDGEYMITGDNVGICLPSNHRATQHS